jgi:TsgA-like MFS transporter
MPYLTFCWGFVTLGLLKLILSLATEMVEVPSPRLVSVLLMAATTGTAISPSLSSMLVAATAPSIALKMGTGCFLLVILLVVFAYRTASRKL